jgi:hypothetical protein
MCNLPRPNGEDKAKHLVQNPHSFVTFQHKIVEIKHKNGAFLHVFSCWFDASVRNPD